MDGSEKFKADFMKIAKTTLSSIILSQDKEHFAKMAVDAVMRLKGSTNLESIQITKKPGGYLIDSFMDEGFIGEELLKNKELVKTEELPTSFTVRNVRNVIKVGKRRLFIGGPLKLTLEEFVRCFHTDGTVTKASMPYNPFIGLLFGRGNVTFTSEAVADEVVDQESFELNGITIEVKTNLQKSLSRHTESGRRASSTFDARMDANRFLQPQTVDDVNYAKIGAVSADKVPFQGRMAFGLFERDGGSEGPSHTANSGGYYGFCKDEGKSDGKREKRKKSELPDEFVQAQKIRAKLFGVNPRRSFTLEEFTEYNEKINMSGGFDIGNVPLDIDFQLMYLRPVQLSPGGLWTLNKVEDISKLALDKYNEDLQKKYEFVKFLKANYSSSIQALELYLTFEAKDTTKDVPVKTFQAHISRLFGGNAEVKFCRTA